MTARTTGRIFNILIDWHVEKVKGGRMDKCNVTVCRYENNDDDNYAWTRAHYGKNITGATRRRLVRYAPLAMLNRKGMPHVSTIYDIVPDAGRLLQAVDAA